MMWLELWRGLVRSSTALVPALLFVLLLVLLACWLLMRSVSLAVLTMASRYKIPVSPQHESWISQPLSGLQSMAT